MRPLLHLWIALALWLVPATVERRVPGGGVRAIEVSDTVALDAIRAPERIEAVVRVPAPTPPRAGGAPALHVSARAALAHASAGRLAAGVHPRLARTAPPPRRLAFPTEATAPPRVRS